MNKKYIGTELELFSLAANWKKYWFDKIKIYLSGSILDVGAGIGSTLNMFSDKDFDSYTALEPDSNNCIKISTNKHIDNFRSKLDIVNGSIVDIEKKFNTIIYIDVLEHIKDDKNELLLASQCLLPGGKIIVLSPAYNFLYSSFDKHVGHYRRYNKKELKLLKPDDLNIDRIFYLDSFGILASLVNRYFLHSEIPSVNQINFWDSIIVPISKVLDIITFFHFGKTVLAIYSKPESVKK